MAIKGGYAIADMTFLTQADFMTLLGGNTVDISKEQFEQISGAINSGKPLFIAFKAPTIPNLVNYMVGALREEILDYPYTHYNVDVSIDLTATGTLVEYNFTCSKIVQSSGNIDYAISVSVVGS